MNATQQFTAEQGITVPKTFVIAGASKVSLIQQNHSIMFNCNNYSVDGQVSYGLFEILLLKKFL